MIPMSLPPIKFDETSLLERAGMNARTNIQVRASQQLFDVFRNRADLCRIEVRGGELVSFILPYNAKRLLATAHGTRWL